MTVDSISSSEKTPEAAAEQAEELRLGDLVKALQRRHRLIVVVIVVFLITGAAKTYWARKYNPTFQGSFRLLVSNPINDAGAEGSGIASVALQRGGPANTATLIEVLTSPLVLEPLERKLNLPPGSIGTSLSVAPGGGRMGTDGVLSVTLLWPNPAQGEQILAKLSQEYLSYSLRQRQEKLTQGLQFLDQQAPDLQKRVNDLQLKLAEIRKDNGFVEPEEQASAMIAKRENLLANLKQLQLEQARLDGQVAAVGRGDYDSGAFASSARQTLPKATGKSRSGTEQDFVRIGGDATDGAATESGDGSVSLEQLFAVETALTEAEANFTENSPQVQELRAKRDWLRPLLQKRLLGQIQSNLSQNLSQQREIQLQLEQLARGFATDPQRIRQYDALEQQLEVARDSLSSYIKARESFRLQMAQRTVPWRILSPPLFGQNPVDPSVSRNLALSLGLGTAAGIGLALLRDRLDHVFHSPQDVKESLNVPLLGVVPYLPRQQHQAISTAIAALEGGARFALKESLRNLFTNFRLLRADKPLRLVAITSSSQGEGKTTSTALFAQTLAQLGQRVLLVDADMRRPMLHSYLGMDNMEGFSSLLTDDSIPVERTIRQLQPGLDLITAGPMPPDATRLLSSKRCAALVEQIRALQGYDLVLFDTPPALLLSDPVLLASHLDGLLFLVGLVRVNRDLPIHALQRVMDTGVDVLALAI